MRKIPESLKTELLADEFMQKCCLAYTGICQGRIEWHHNLIYGGRQQNVSFAILPLCHGHHLKADLKVIKPILDKIMTLRATPEELALYPKRKWLKYQ
jgi:hypothetical protein